MPSFEGKWRQDTLDALWKKLQKAIEDEERIQTAFLHVLKRADAEFVYQKLAEHGAKLVKAKKFKESVGFLLPLKDFPGVKPENKFHLALAQLKLHSHTVATNRQHPAVELLTDLYRGSAYPVFETLKKEKGLAPEDLIRARIQSGRTRRPGTGIGHRLARARRREIPAQQDRQERQEQAQTGGRLKAPRGFANQKLQQNLVIRLNLLRHLVCGLR